MIFRHRRLRRTDAIRKLVSDIALSPDHLIYPLFIVEGRNIHEEITSMPGQFRFSIDKIKDHIDEINKAGIKHVLLFGIPQSKDETGSGAYAKKGVVQQAVREIKRLNNELTVITDACLCEYTSHGHCGIIKDGYVDNDATLDYIAKTALSQAEAGADIIAPSDMMDGRVAAIRNSLENNGFKETAIMSYSVKYASAYYGPFRDAADSAPRFGDRRSYQMDFTRQKEPMTEALQDIKEGADIIMVKPALAYLDIIRYISDEIHHPVAAYNVSGEYAMVKAAAAKGWIDEQRVVMENMIAIKRAGASIVITYHALDIARWLQK